MIVMVCNGCHSIAPTIALENTHANKVLRLEMSLSAFGVESDNFPSIDAVVDFVVDSSLCKRSFYNPAFKPSSYVLAKTEIEELKKILSNTNLAGLKKEYSVNKTDQPTSTTSIYTTQQKFIIKDYGMESDSLLQKIYSIVYKL